MTVSAMPKLHCIESNQGVWLEMSLDGGGVKDELDGLGRVALVVLEPT
jgi:hypothetical protein